MHRCADQVAGVHGNTRGALQNRVVNRSMT
jgi:hypothetical protein